MNATLQKIIDYTILIADPEKIILFGSMASGNITSQSDVDLLIVLDDTDKKRELSKMITTFCKGFSLRTDVLIYSETELAWEKQKPNSFLSAICKDGKLVYHKQPLFIN